MKVADGTHVWTAWSRYGLPPREAVRIIFEELGYQAIDLTGYFKGLVKEREKSRKAGFRYNGTKR